MVGPFNGEGMKTTQSTAFFFENLTKTIQETGKGALTVDSGKRAGTGIFKASKDFARGDTICAGLCGVSAGCEVIAGVLIWCPIPGKIVAVSTLKATSIGCQRFRDLCASDPSSPLC